MPLLAHDRKAAASADARRRFLADLADVPERERAVITEMLSDSHVFPVYWCVAVAVGVRAGAWVVDGPFAARSVTQARHLAAQAAATLEEARVVGPFPVTTLRALVGLG
jgi:hypothetical protein